MRDYMNRRVTPPKLITSPTWGPPPPCKQAVRKTWLHEVPTDNTRATRPLSVIHHFHKDHNTSCLPPKILFQFLLGTTVVPTDIEDNGYAKFQGANKVHYGRCENSEQPTLSRRFSIFGLVFFVLNSLLGIARQWSRKKMTVLTLKPRSLVRILK